MSRQQNTILWLGIALIAMNIAMSWTSTVKPLLGKASGGSSGTSSTKPTTATTSANAIPTPSQNSTSSPNSTGQVFV